MGLPRQDAEDLVQDCAALVFSSIGEFDPSKGTLDAWLSGYARNVARSWWRGNSTRGRSELAVDGTVDRPAPTKKEAPGGGVIEAAISGLGPVDQELLHMRFGFGYSFDEIAEMSGITAVSARKRVSRAVDVLRRDPELRAALGFLDQSLS